MLIFITIVHVILCVFLIFVILLQPGKDAGMGAALGGGAASSAFGGRGAVTLLSRVTGVCASIFFLTALGLSFVGLRQSVANKSLVAPTAPASKPAAPATPPPASPTGSAAPATGAPAAPAAVQAGKPGEPAAPAQAPKPTAPTDIPPAGPQK